MARLSQEKASYAVQGGIDSVDNSIVVASQ